MVCVEAGGTEAVGRLQLGQGTNLFSRRDWMGKLSDKKTEVSPQGQKGVTASKRLNNQKKVLGGKGFASVESILHRVT